MPANNIKIAISFKAVRAPSAVRHTVADRHIQCGTVGAGLATRDDFADHTSALNHGIFEGKKPVQSGVDNRYLRTCRFFQALRQRTGRLLLTMLVLALVFASAAVLQHSFVHAQLYRTIRQELGLWAAQITGEIAYKDRWDLAGYRRASILAPGWNIVTEDGLLARIFHTADRREPVWASGRVAEPVKEVRIQISSISAII